MFQSTMFADTPSATGSPGLEDGASPSDSPGGPTPGQSGAGRLRANRSQSPGLDAGQPTSGTSGRSSTDLFGTVTRPSLSGSRSHRQKLSARSLRLLSLSRFRPVTTPGPTSWQTDLSKALRSTIGGDGSTLFTLTWQTPVTPSGTPYCRLRASGRSTSGKDCGSWATPRANKTGGKDMEDFSPSLHNQVSLASWPSPNAGPQNDTDSTWEARRAALKAQHKNGNGFGMTLGMATQLASWPSPTTLRGYGNAIVPAVAAEVIRAYMEVA